MNVRARYDKTIQDIEERAANPYLGLQEIADEVAKANAMIMRDMVSVFKYLTGNTLRGYISERKMMASYKYLIQNDVRDIEHALEIAGYMDQPSYTKAFKLCFGIAPGEAYKKKDLSLYVEPLTWDAISNESAASPLLGKEQNTMPEAKRFGISEAQYSKVAEAMELEAFYDFSPLMSEYAFGLAEKIGKSLPDAFRFVDSYRDYVIQHSEEDEDLAEDFPLVTKEQILHEYGDDPFYQKMFFERNISVETISYFETAHDATHDELLECDPEMLAAYSETFDMSFHFFMQAWKKYMEHTGGVYNPEQFQSYLEKLDEWMPIETALDAIDCELTDEELEDAIRETSAEMDIDREVYLDDIDEVMEKAYLEWDGSRIDDDLNYDPDDPDAYDVDSVDRMDRLGGETWPLDDYFYDIDE